jgi:hypothetical protein
VATAQLACSECGEPMDIRTVRAVPGTAARATDFEHTALAGQA